MSGLTREQRAEYEQRGYLRVPALFDSGEVAALKAECERLDRDASLPPPAHETFPRIDGAGRTLRNLIDPVVPRSALFRALLEKPSVVGVLGSVLGNEPRLFKDKLILRPPGTAGYGLHQDYAYWGWTGVPADRIVAFQIAIDDADARNGAVAFHAGRHDALLPAADAGGNDIERSLLPPEESEIVPTRAGDAVIFHSLTPHWSDVNRSGRPRRTLYLTYNAASCGDLYRIYYQDRVLDP